MVCVEKQGSAILPSLFATCGSGPGLPSPALLALVALGLPACPAELPCLPCLQSSGGGRGPALAEQSDLPGVMQPGTMLQAWAGSGSGAVESPVGNPWGAVGPISPQGSGGHGQPSLAGAQSGPSPPAAPTRTSAATSHASTAAPADPSPILSVMHPALVEAVQEGGNGMDLKVCEVCAGDDAHCLPAAFLHSLTGLRLKRLSPHPAGRAGGHHAV